MGSYQSMSRAEADKIIEWVEGELVGEPMTAWQRDIFATMLMHPDVHFELSPRRRG